VCLTDSFLSLCSGGVCWDRALYMTVEVETIVVGEPWNVNQGSWAWARVLLQNVDAARPPPRHSLLRNVSGMVFGAEQEGSRQTSRRSSVAWRGEREQCCEPSTNIVRPWRSFLLVFCFALLCFPLLFFSLLCFSRVLVVLACEEILLIHLKQFTQPVNFHHGQAKEPHRA